MDSIQEGKFSLEVLLKQRPAEKILYKGFNYFNLHNGSNFKIKLGNHSDRRTDVHLWYDGKKIGIYRINPHSIVVVDSENFYAIRRMENYLQKNLIRVVYQPEIEMKPKMVYNNPTVIYLTNGSINKKCFNNYTDTVTPYNKLNNRCLLPACDYLKNRPLYGKGLVSTFPDNTTGLNIKENSRYKMVDPIEKIDKELQTTIYARIVVNKDKPSYRKTYNGIKQSKYNNKVPPLMDLRYPSRPHTCNVDSSFTFSKPYYFSNM